MKKLGIFLFLCSKQNLINYKPMGYAETNTEQTRNKHGTNNFFVPLAFASLFEKSYRDFFVPLS